MWNIAIQILNFLQLNCYLSAANRTWIENLLPSPKRDGFGGQHRHRCDYFVKPSLPIILRCFLRHPIIANDYFTIITIIGPTINCSDASLKSKAALWFTPHGSIQSIWITLPILWCDRSFCRTWCPGNPDCEDPKLLCQDLIDDYHSFQVIDDQMITLINWWHNQPKLQDEYYRC